MHFGLDTDRLGSVIAITNVAGALREQMAYGSWGKRRRLNGAPVNGTPTPDNLDGVTDNKGYTGHEMLDQLDLVHMNGRIYDPLVAKMMPDQYHNNSRWCEADWSRTPWRGLHGVVTKCGGHVCT